MSLHGFTKAIELHREDVPFYALIMAAMIKADTENIEKLKAAWPHTYRELQERYDAPGGRLEHD